ncbi:ATP-binding protein [Oceanospirillum sediminis]|uniref:histidine kinase n=1 Tax=Oceanospirillum sediminis TaxID=2760088 RepID=A0A839IWS7_9GAMM|nr:ATP-binding protein [Oceanospirillum sediminis]MBB1488909.1 GHKL domain-containing protein [Oceanospirillum sediminis]
MKKSFFLQLLILIILLVSISQASQISRIFDLWSPHMTMIEHHRFQGTRALLERHLQSFPPSERQRQVDSLQPEFGYYLGYQAIEQLSLSDEQWQQLEQQTHIFDPDSLNHYLLSEQVRTNRPQVLVIQNIDMDTGHVESPIEKGLTGNARLIEAILLRFPQSQWSDLVQQIQPDDGIPYALHALESLSLTAGQQIALQQTGITFQPKEEYEQSADMAFSRIGNSQQILVQGPVTGEAVSRYQMSALAAYFLMLAGMIGLPVALWLWPVWRFSGRIKQYCQQCAQGDFSQRLSLKAAGQLAPLAEVLNTMADRVDFSRQQSQTFSHAISHDIRTPLTNLSFSLELYRRADNPEQKQKIMRRMQASLTEIKQLQTELDMFSRFEHQVVRMPLNTEPLAEFWQEVQNKWQHLPAQHAADGKTLTIAASQCQALCQLNNHYLQRALDNLINNALRHADSQVRVTLNQVESGQIGTHCVISVENDGQPIDKQDQERIFQPFVRLEESRNRDSGGAGLGLSIVRAIAEAHNGKVSVMSEVSSGWTCFQITLPVYQSEEQHQTGSD